MTTVALRTFTDDDWIAGLRAGHNDLVGPLRARVRLGLAAALAGRADVCDADLDDFTQDAVLQILGRLGSFRGDSKFTTWAMAVAVRVSLTNLRRRRWAGNPLDERLEELARPAWSGGTDGGFGEREELLTALRSAIAEVLTPRQRQVLLGKLEGIPQVVLADRLGSSPGAIYKRSHDARRTLKKALVKLGYDAQAVYESLAGQR